MRLASFQNLLIVGSILLTVAFQSHADQSQVGTPPTKQILEFEDGNFKQLMEQHDWIVLLMYTPWNRRSTEMLFNLAKLRNLVGRDVGHQFEIARVNCQTQRGVCTHLHEFQYPAIRLLRRGFSTVVYQSFWDIEYVAKWLRRFFTAMHPLDGSREALLKFTSAPHYVLGVFKEKSADYLEFSKLVFQACHEYDEYNFGYMMYEAALMEGIFSPNPPWDRTRVEVALFNDTWKTPSTIVMQTERALRIFSRTQGDELFMVSEMENFMYAYAEPAIVPFIDRHNMVRYLDYGFGQGGPNTGPPRPVLIYFANMSDPYLERKLEIVRAASFAMVGRVTSLHTDRRMTQPLQERLLGHTSVDLGNLDELLVFVYPRQLVHHVFPTHATFSTQKIIQWSLDALHGRLVPLSRSYKEKTTTPTFTRGALAVSFDELLDMRFAFPHSEFLVHLTDNVCGECKRWWPFFAETAVRLRKHRPDVHAVAVDVRRNSFPMRKERGFSREHNVLGESVGLVDPLTNELLVRLPQTVLLRGIDMVDTEDVLLYSGDRSVESLLLFVSKTATISDPTS